MTECIQETFSFAAHFSRRVAAAFTAGQVSSDGGALLLREVDRKIKLLGRLGSCFSDGRNQELVEHRLEEMLSQRIYALALGYEDLNDHEQLRTDPLFGLLSGRRELEERLAGKSTLNRLGLGGGTDGVHKNTSAAERPRPGWRCGGARSAITRSATRQSRSTGCWLIFTSRRTA